MPASTIKVDRTSMFGNPYPVHDGTVRLRTAEDAVAAFRDHVAATPSLQEMIARRLPGMNLACWCALDQPCHADVLLELANRQGAQA